jgi:hypothetical protein
MAALAVQAGENLSLQTIIQLGAEIEAIYMLTSLEGRGLDLIKQHQELWKRTLDFFDSAVAIWESVATDGELLRAHRRLLNELRALVDDRLAFYSVHEDRRAYRQRKLD